LTKNSSGGTATASGGKTATGTTSGGQTAAATALKNGTYTFFPRPRAVQGGTDKNSYVVKIVARGGFFNVYLSSDAVSKNSDFYDFNTSSWQGPNGWGKSSGVKIILQDIDNPRRVYEYTKTEDGQGEDSNLVIITFEKVTTGKRFSLTGEYDPPPFVFEEIDLGNAEYEP
jgi:hypothetical protein